MNIGMMLKKLEKNVEVERSGIIDGSVPMGFEERGCGTLGAGLRSQAFEERPAQAGLEEPSEEKNLLAEGPPGEGSVKRHIVP